MTPLPPTWAESWQHSWDELEDTLVGDRALRIDALLDAVEAVAGPAPTVLDLGCGTGTVTRRLLSRLPSAHTIALDVDPVLLTIAAATFAGDSRVRIARADLRDPAWTTSVPEAPVDAVVTATALHWLPEPAVTRLYRDLSRMVRPGGIVAHAEQMPLATPRLASALTALDGARHPGPAARREAWDAWWAHAAQDPALATALDERRTVFATSYPTEEFSPPADWHIASLLAAGFTEATVTWRSGHAAVVTALR
jgi:SAM-dependent methyltransferase